MVRFDISIALDYTVLEPTDFIFNIQPAHTARQRVTWEQLAVVPPVTVQEERHGTPGNRILRLRCEPGMLNLKYDAIIDITHHFALPGDLGEHPVAELPADVLPYVYPSRYCPSDRFAQLANLEFGAMAPGYARVEAIRQWVNDRTRFQPGSSHASTSALDTYEAGAGVCRDFAHLMISMCRALNMPARFCSSIDYGADPALGPPDFHSCVEVYLDRHWYVFDPSGISPRTGLVRIGTGRDASDVSYATIFGKVIWNMPRISITAIDDAGQGVTEPSRHDYAVSTDAAFPELDAIAESPDERGAQLDAAAPVTPRPEAAVQMRG